MFDSSKNSINCRVKFNVSKTLLIPISIIFELHIYTYLLYCWFQYLDFDNLPDTNFTCAGKVIGGYYADLETSCQMFHVCTVGQQDEPMDIKFLCLNGTVFDQVRDWRELPTSYRTRWWCSLLFFFFLSFLPLSIDLT